MCVIFVSFLLNETVADVYKCLYVVQYKLKQVGTYASNVLELSIHIHF